MCAVLAGCGWRLQGAEQLPQSMAVIRIDTADTYSDFFREMRGQLQAAGATVQNSNGTAPAPAVMQVHRDETGQRVLSVSARNTPEEYEVYYRVEYSVQVGGAEIIPRQELQLTASYSYDSRIVLAKQHEQQGMQQALARELAAVVMRRLSTLQRAASAAPQS